MSHRLILSIVVECSWRVRVSYQGSKVNLESGSHSSWYRGVHCQPTLGVTLVLINFLHFLTTLKTRSVTICLSKHVPCASLEKSMKLGLKPLVKTGACTHGPATSTHMCFNTAACTACILISMRNPTLVAKERCGRCSKQRTAPIRSKVVGGLYYVAPEVLRRYYGSGTEAEYERSMEALASDLVKQHLERKQDNISELVCTQDARAGSKTGEHKPSQFC
jgi:hypothetical protein